MKPKIAIPAATLTEATNVINERNAPFAPRPIIEAVVKSGGVPIIFPSVRLNISRLLMGLFLLAGLMLIQHFTVKNRT